MGKKKKAIAIKKPLETRRCSQINQENAGPNTQHKAPHTDRLEGAVALMPLFLDA